MATNDARHGRLATALVKVRQLPFEEEYVIYAYAHRLTGFVIYIFTCIIVTRMIYDVFLFLFLSASDSHTH